MTKKRTISELPNQAVLKSREFSSPEAKSGPTIRPVDDADAVMPIIRPRWLGSTISEAMALRSGRHTVEPQNAKNIIAGIQGIVSAVATTNKEIAKVTEPIRNIFI